MTTLALDAAHDTLALRRNDWRIIILIGLVHASSHFMQLLLPALYLSLSAEFGFDFVQLGLLVSVFFVVSGVGQASSGFVVDRIGPVPVLMFGLACFVLSALMIGAANGYVMLMLGAVLGGVGNSIFHPADYSILNHRVSNSRLGHAFSAHGLTGNLGWALTPVFISTITLLAGWRVATFAAAAVVALMLTWVYLWRQLLQGLPLLGIGPAVHQTAKTTADQTAANQTMVGATTSSAAVHDASAHRRRSAPIQPSITLGDLLGQPALWGAFLFFALTSIGFSAVQQYTIPLFTGLYQVDELMAGSTVSAYMIAAACGMAAGGFLVSASAASERVVAISLVFSGVLLALLAVGGMPMTAAVALIALAGFCSGVAAPSRDMLVRRVTPKGATGSVYGLVYSGMDVGMALGPVFFGLMLDHGLDQGPWLGAGVSFVVAAWMALMVARFATRARQAA